jgi:hypothetical protein
MIRRHLVSGLLFPDKARFQQYYEALLAIQQYYCPGILMRDLPKKRKEPF